MTSEYPKIPLEETEQENAVAEIPPAEETPAAEAFPCITLDDIEGNAPEAEPVEESPDSPEAAETIVEESEVPVEAEPVVEEPAAFTETETVTPPPAQKPAKVKKQRRKPHIALRIPLQLLSFILAVVMFATLLAGIVLMDLRQLFSSGGIKQLISAILTPTASAPAVIVPDRGPLHVTPIDTDATGDIAPDDGFIVDEDGNISIGGSSIDLGDIPDDILTGGGSDSNIDALVDWIYTQIDESIDEELKMTKEDMQSFVEKSTVSDFLAQKLSDYADDFINGTSNASITPEEIMALLEENAELMESELNIKLDKDQKEKLTASITTIVEEQDLDNTIRESVNEAMDKVLQENSQLLGGLTRQDIQNILQTLVSDQLLFGAVGAFVVLLLLLCLANFYNVPAGLTWASFSCIIAGGLMSVPLIVLQYSSEFVADLIPVLSGVTHVLSTFVDLFAPIHFSVLITGVVLLVGSIVWRIVRAVVRKRRPAAV